MVYVKAEVNVLPGKLARFSELIKELVPVIAEVQWTIAGAYLNVSGRQDSLLIIWQVPDANALVNLGGQMEKNPRLTEILHRIHECVEPEIATLVTDAPFAPTRSRAAT